jgi:hypothetical protein
LVVEHPCRLGAYVYVYVYVYGTQTRRPWNFSGTAGRVVMDGAASGSAAYLKANDGVT